MGRKLGQHFLRSHATIKEVVHILALPDTAVIVEVGPGKGALTEHLLKRAPVVAVEKDGDLVDFLHERFTDMCASGRLTLHHGDARDDGWLDLVAEAPYAVIASIPYYLTGALIKKMLTCAHRPAAMALVVQKEVGERIARSNKGSLLSLSVRLFGTPMYVRTIPRTAFRPSPQVDSSLITITDIQAPPKSVQEAFFTLIHTAFHEKRKSVLKKFASSPTVTAHLTGLGVTPTMRAEDVPFGVWLSAAQQCDTI